MWYLPTGRKLSPVYYLLTMQQQVLMIKFSYVVPIFHFWQKPKLVFRSLQTLAFLMNLQQEMTNLLTHRLSLLVSRNRSVFLSVARVMHEHNRMKESKTNHQWKLQNGNPWCLKTCSVSVIQKVVTLVGFFFWGLSLCWWRNLASETIWYILELLSGPFASILFIHNPIFSRSTILFPLIWGDNFFKAFYKLFQLT